LLWFKHEERPLLVYPHKLIIGRTQPDELNRPLNKVNVAFTLPPGSYATLVVKRLFHFAPSESGETEESHHAVRRERDGAESHEPPKRYDPDLRKKRHGEQSAGDDLRVTRDDRPPARFDRPRDDRGGPRGPKSHFKPRKFQRK